MTADGHAPYRPGARYAEAFSSAYRPTPTQTAAPVMRSGFRPWKTWANPWSCRSDKLTGPEADVVEVQGELPLRQGSGDRQRQGDEAGRTDRQEEQ